MPKLGAGLDRWLVRNAAVFTKVIEILFGAVWLVDGGLKLQPGFLSGFSDLVAGSAAGQPQWLQGWFSFWVSVTSYNPELFAYLITASELALAFALILGFMRKTAYAGGAILSLLIWSVPEGFGGPYGPSSTDIGTGMIYAIVFLLLLAMNATYRNNRYTLDSIIEKHIRWWRVISDLNR